MVSAISDLSTIPTMSSLKESPTMEQQIEVHLDASDFGRVSSVVSENVNEDGRVEPESETSVSTMRRVSTMPTTTTPKKDVAEDSNNNEIPAIKKSKSSYDDSNDVPMEKLLKEHEAMAGSTLKAVEDTASAASSHKKGFSMKKTLSMLSRSSKKSIKSQKSAAKSESAEADIETIPVADDDKSLTKTESVKSGSTKDPADDVATEKALSEKGEEDSVSLKSVRTLPKDDTVEVSIGEENKEGPSDEFPAPAVPVEQKEESIEELLGLAPGIVADVAVEEEIIKTVKSDVSDKTNTSDKSMKSSRSMKSTHSVKSSKSILTNKSKKSKADDASAKVRPAVSFDVKTFPSEDKSEMGKASQLSTIDDASVGDKSSVAETSADASAILEELAAGQLVAEQSVKSPTSVTEDEKSVKSSKSSRSNKSNKSKASVKQVIAGIVSGASPTSEVPADEKSVKSSRSVKSVKSEAPVQPEAVAEPEAIEPKAADEKSVKSARSVKSIKSKASTQRSVADELLEEKSVKSTQSAKSSTSVKAPVEAVASATTTDVVEEIVADEKSVKSTHTAKSSKSKASVKADVVESEAVANDEDVKTVASHKSSASKQEPVESEMAPVEMKKTFSLKKTLSLRRSSSSASKTSVNSKSVKTEPAQTTTEPVEAAKDVGETAEAKEETVIAEPVAEDTISVKKSRSILSINPFKRQSSNASATSKKSTTSKKSVASKKSVVTAKSTTVDTPIPEAEAETPAVADETTDDIDETNIPKFGSAYAKFAASVELAEKAEKAAPSTIVEEKKDEAGDAKVDWKAAAKEVSQKYDSIIASLKSDKNIQTTPATTPKTEIETPVKEEKEVTAQPVVTEETETAAKEETAVKNESKDREMPMTNTTKTTSKKVSRDPWKALCFWM